MKTQNFITMIVVLGLAVPSHARVVESAENVNNSEWVTKVSSAWTQIETQAKEKIQSWTDAFKAKMAELKGEAQPQREIATAPAPIMDPVRRPNTDTTPSTPNAAPMAMAPAQPQVTPEQQQMAQLISTAKDKIVGKEAIVEATPGRAGTSKLKTSKSGVPLFVKVSKIPRLDIGVERTISKNDFVIPESKIELKKLAKPKELESPVLMSKKTIADLKAKKLPVVAKAESPKRGDFELGQIVTQKKIDDISLAMGTTHKLEEMKPYVETTRDDLKMLAALILFKRGDKCHMSSGLFTGLAENKKYVEEANFYLGICAHQMGFHSEAVNRLLKVINSENPDFTTDAITTMSEDLPGEYFTRVASAIHQVKMKNAIADKAKDNVNYIFARAAHSQAAYSEAAKYANMVTEKSEHYASARYIYGIALYADKKAKEAEQVLLSLHDWMASKNKVDKNIEALVAVNLARMRFLQARYQAANEQYLKIPKDHPLWVEGLIEQGWTQLSMDDAPGAIGNMYSLHSPYFKAVFMPESWVVRTIGYIDICQYGDAYKTLTKLEQLHTHWLTAVDQYAKTNKSPIQYYQTVKNYLKGKSDQDTDGLPFQVIREIARQRGFLNAQNELNDMEDEIAQYNFVFGLVKKDQTEMSARLARAKARLAKVKGDIAKMKTNHNLVQFANEWNATKRLEEENIKNFEFQMVVYEEARKGYLQMRANALARIEGEKNKLRLAAGHALETHLKDIHNRIAQIIEGNEFLRYEIFAGSGENIRYQVAGGTTTDGHRLPSAVKPQKILNWEFDGEYWEDEIGSYRSTLKNNCPKNARGDS